MHSLVLFLFVVAFSCEYLVSLGWLPELVPYIQEVIGLIAAGFVVSIGIRSRFQYVRPAYWLAFGALAVVLLCGVIANGVSTGPVFAGMRNYLRAIPLFFLPAVLLFTESQVRTQLRWLLAMSFMQVPIALYQRVTTFKPQLGHITADSTFGTLMNSSILSIFLISAICVATGFMLRRRLSRTAYLVIFLALLLPTTVNETKGTLVLLPMGLMAVLVCGTSGLARVRSVLVAVGLLAVFLAIYVPIYDYYGVARRGETLEDFFTKEGRLASYLDRRTGFGSKAEAGRLEGVTVPLQAILRDPVTAAFGYGIGSASDSALGESFTGEVFRQYEPFLVSSGSTLILETGLSGMMLIMLIHWLVFLDSRAVAASERGPIGSLALGWCGVSAVMAIGLFYKDTIAYGALSFTFWYLSGLIAAHRMRSSLQWQHVRTAPAAAAPVSRVRVAP